MSEFINTIDVLGDDAVIDGIISNTITEFRDDIITTIGPNAFTQCTSIELIDTPSVTTVAKNAFASCANLESVNLPNATGMIPLNCFDNCRKLNILNMPLVTSISLNGLVNCRSLHSVCFPLVTTIGVNSIRYCQSMLRADFSSLTSIESYALAGADSIYALILRNTNSVATLQANGLEYGDNKRFTSGLAYIYVPRALIDSYKTATNWSAYANCIRALEDYTVDGTVTGELDETKI